RRQAVAGDRGGGVVLAVDGQDERLLAAQAEAVLPLEFQLAVAVDDRRRADDRGAPRVHRLAVDLGRGQLARRGGAERRPAALHQRDRAAAHVLLLRARTAEVLRQD